MLILGGVSVYVGCIRNARLLVDSMSKTYPNAGAVYILCGIIALAISAILIFLSISDYIKRNPDSIVGIKKYVFGIIGVIVGITGGVLCFIGNHMNNDTERQLKAYLSEGNKDATGDLLFYGGIGLVIIAVLLILINIFQYYTLNKNKN